jgi:hypothetical protein
VNILFYFQKEIQQNGESAVQNRGRRGNLPEQAEKCKQLLDNAK